VPKFDILGIGNAIVDVVSMTDDFFLAAHGMRKGGMALIDSATAEALYAAMPPGQESSGGSVANSCAVAAGLGARVAYLGKVADDGLGRIFHHDLAAIGVTAPTKPLVNGAPTARCLIAVTPDGQRTMNTFLGACVEFGPADLDAAMIADATVTYMEGYLFDPPEAQAAFRAAAQIAHKAGRKVALSLSDAFCVDRHREAFSGLVAGHVDILFANETEIKSLFQTKSLDVAMGATRLQVELAVITLGENGSVILCGDQTVRVAAEKTTVVDTTGAGDAYAAGFLYGLTRDLPLRECGRIASIAAAQVIAQVGARPLHDLKPLIAA
jgi:fructokinase